ncbi:type II toxin-antitoxin system RatA family toxin [Parvularcula oceani]|uniref:type II toxin-antitoxin system RatA family toxin n=1 Tax=Parvularcula oceani TaxID=1247963 RepID=UPI0004E1695C|nr:type II toxin-antitoxin system RatA family toxin [Parvularcula oceani]
MRQHHERRALPYSPEQMFDLVADVESYPRFIPWVEALRVLRSDVEDGQGTLTADMSVGYKMFRESFRSEVTLDRDAKTIGVNYIRGPLKSLTNDWRFEPAEGGCVVDFTITFSFRNRLMQMAANQLMEKGFMRLVGAFEAEARRRYG